MKRIPVPMTDKIHAALDHPGRLGLAEDMSRAQVVVTLAEEAIALREERISTAARRARYSAWADDPLYRRAVAEDSALALSEKAI